MFIVISLNDVNVLTVLDRQQGSNNKMNKTKVSNGLVI